MKDENMTKEIYNMRIDLLRLLQRNTAYTGKYQELIHLEAKERRKIKALEGD